MPHTGQYEEPIGDGGKLCVRKDHWEIHYYFLGPDMRYKGTFLTIDGSRVQGLIDAYRAAFERYEQLKQSVPAGGSLTVLADMNLTIRVRGFNEGVCISNSHLPVSSSAQLEQRVQNYRRAIERASVVQKMLAAL